MSYVIEKKTQNLRRDMMCFLNPIFGYIFEQLKINTKSLTFLFQNEPPKYFENV